LSCDTLVNTSGHTGYELVPRAVSGHWLLKWFNTVTHHDDHHTNTRVNFGVFFNLWDRWMGTFQGEDSRERSIAVGKPSERAADVDRIRPQKPPDAQKRSPYPTDTVGLCVHRGADRS